MIMTLRLPPEIEDQLKQLAEIEHRSVQQTVLVAIEEYLQTRETAEILADPAALRGLAEARDSEQAGDVVYGADRCGTSWPGFIAHGLALSGAYHHR
jgi:predicted transcriptional regulator